MYSTGKHLMMRNNQDSERKQESERWSEQSNEPRTTRKCHQKDLETAGTSVTEKTKVIHYTPKASMEAPSAIHWEKRASIEALVVECITYSCLCNTCTCCSQVFLETFLGSPGLINYCSDHRSDSLVPFLPIMRCFPFEYMVTKLFIENLFIAHQCALTPLMLVCTDRR